MVWIIAYVVTLDGTAVASGEEENRLNTHWQRRFSFGAQRHECILQHLSFTIGERGVGSDGVQCETSAQHKT
ncbi:hypothetical protein F4824DRAFT_497420 [Ustulina deusta]|nr:hypothetical protein F4824DRAFT_497420 [Ustulina deusta]